MLKVRITRIIRALWRALRGSPAQDSLDIKVFSIEAVGDLLLLPLRVGLTRNPKPETRDPKPETLNPEAQPETLNPTVIHSLDSRLCLCVGMRVEVLKVVLLGFRALGFQGLGSLGL